MIEPTASSRPRVTRHPVQNDIGLGRRERGKRDKLKRIKRAARSLFSRHGFHGTTTRQIAEAADIGAGTLFLYAVNKEDLLVQIFRDEVGAAIDRAFATMPNRALLDQVMHVFRAMIVHHRENPALARIFVKELPFVEIGVHGIDEFMQSLYERLIALVDAAKMRGEVREDAPARMLAHNLFSIFYIHLQRWLGRAGPVSDPRESALRSALDLQLGGLRTKPARKVRSRRIAVSRRPA